MEANYFTILYWFCCTSTWIRHRCTRVPLPEPHFQPPSLYHPSGSSQCTSPEHPVSCIKPGLVIRFTCDTIHVILPNHPTLALSHRVQKTVLYICVYFFPFFFFSRSDHMVGLVRHYPRDFPMVMDILCLCYPVWSSITGGHRSLKVWLGWLRDCPCNLIWT